MWGVARRDTVQNTAPNTSAAAPSTRYGTAKVAGRPLSVSHVTSRAVLLDSPHYHAIKFDAEYTDSYVCVTNPDNTNPAIQLFLDLIEEADISI